MKKIFQDKIDERVHNQFVRFGKGKYENRARINLQVKKDKIRTTSSFEYANDFVELAGEIIGKENSKVSGVVLSKESISEQLKEKGISAEEKKKAMIFENPIEQELSGEQLKFIIDNSYFSLFDISSQELSLKTKKKLPRPGKGREAKVDDKFCVLECSLKFLQKIKDAFFFDVPECKKCRIAHTYEISEIVMPKEEKNFEKIRLLAKRKGKLIRRINADNKEILKEKEFEA